MFVISNIMGSRNLLYIFPFSFLKAHQYKSVEFFDTVIVQSTENASFQNKFKILAFLHAKITYDAKVMVQNVDPYFSRVEGSETKLFFTKR